MKKKLPPIPSIVFLNPYGMIFIRLEKDEKGEIRYLPEFMECEVTEEERCYVAVYLYQEGFIDAIERGSHK